MLKFEGRRFQNGGGGRVAGGVTGGAGEVGTKRTIKHRKRSKPSVRRSSVKTNSSAEWLGRTFRFNGPESDTHQHVASLP